MLLTPLWTNTQLLKEMISRDGTCLYFSFVRFTHQRFNIFTANLNSLICLFSPNSQLINNLYQQKNGYDKANSYPNPIKNQLTLSQLLQIPPLYLRILNQRHKERRRLYRISRPKLRNAEELFNSHQQSHIRLWSDHPCFPLQCPYGFKSQFTICPYDRMSWRAARNNFCRQRFRSSIKRKDHISNRKSSARVLWSQNLQTSRYISWRNNH